MKMAGKHYCLRIVMGLKSATKQLKRIARVGVQEAVYMAGRESEKKKKAQHTEPIQARMECEKAVWKMSRGRYDVRVNNERTTQDRYRGLWVLPVEAVVEGHETMRISLDIAFRPHRRARENQAVNVTACTGIQFLACALAGVGIEVFTAEVFELRVEIGERVGTLNRTGRRMQTSAARRLSDTC